MSDPVLGPPVSAPPAVVTPQALADSVLCARYGVAPEQLQSWQARQVVTVDVAADGRISDASPGKRPPPG